MWRMRKVFFSFRFFFCKAYIIFFLSHVRRTFREGQCNEKWYAWENNENYLVHKALGSLLILIIDITNFFFFRSLFADDDSLKGITNMKKRFWREWLRKLKRKVSKNERKLSIEKNEWNFCMKFIIMCFCVAKSTRCCCCWELMLRFNHVDIKII